MPLTSTHYHFWRLKMTAHIPQILLEGGTTNVIDFQVIKIFCTRQLFKTPTLFQRTIFTWLQHDSFTLWMIQWGSGSIEGDVRLPLCANGIRNSVDFDQLCSCHWRASGSLFVSWRHNSERIYRLSRRGEESAGDVLGLPVWSPVCQTGERQHFQHSRQQGESRGHPFLCANW